jgi:hypothetical protein
MEGGSSTSGTPGVGEARRTDLDELAEYFDKTDAGELMGEKRSPLAR